MNVKTVMRSSVRILISTPSVFIGSPELFQSLEQLRGVSRARFDLQRPFAVLDGEFDLAPVAIEPREAVVSEERLGEFLYRDLEDR